MNKTSSTIGSRLFFSFSFSVKLIDDREKQLLHVNSKNHQQDGINKKEILVINYILVYNVGRWPLLKMHIDPGERHRFFRSS